MKSNIFANKTLFITMTTLLLGTNALATTTNATQPNDLLNATLWMQNSVEYKANVRNIYQLAKIRLDQALQDPQWTALKNKQNVHYSHQAPAIILDCDETIIDNSAYEAYLIKTGQSFNSKTWTQYVQSKSAKAMPGALEFTRYAANKGVTVFYITNRKKTNEQATFDNMKTLGFPMGNGHIDTLLTKNEKPEWTSKKESRDNFVAKNYRVLLMFGDNLGDFTDQASGSLKQRHTAYLDNQTHWGKDWLMLPNPAYGSFDGATFKFNYALSDNQRRQMKINTLKSWMK